MLGTVRALSFSFTGCLHPPTGSPCRSSSELGHGQTQRPPPCCSPCHGKKSRTQTHWTASSPLLLQQKLLLQLRMFLGLDFASPLLHYKRKEPTLRNTTSSQTFPAISTGNTTRLEDICKVGMMPCLDNKPKLAQLFYTPRRERGG